MDKKEANAWNNTYSKIFIFVFFAFLTIQLFGAKLTVNTISDRFLLRMYLIKEFNTFRYSLGDRIFNSGIVGKDNWLFYSGDFSINDYQKTAPIGKKDLKELEKILTSLNEATMKNDGVLLVVIPPDKNTIYPQYMPKQISVIGQTSRLDQFMAYMREHTDIQIIDLRPALVDASQSSQVYFKSDAHWNCLGAYYASDEIISKIIPYYPQIQPRPLSDFEINTTIDSSLDISATMALGLQEETWLLTPKFTTNIEILTEPLKENKLMRVAVNSRQDLPVAVILHDSFYNECLNQFMEPYFSKTFSFHYGTAFLTDYLELIEKQKPNIVIVEFAERHIEYFLRLITASENR